MSPEESLAQRIYSQAFILKTYADMLCQTFRHMAKGIKAAQLSFVTRSCWLWNSRCQHGLTTQIVRCISIKKYDTHLLVDADSQPIQVIEEAEEALGGKGVHVHVFADPERRENKKWSKLFDRANITFHPVERVSGTIDPNDAAIIAEAKVLANLQKTRRIAVLTNDRDFVPLGHVVKELGKEAIALTPRGKGTKRFYEDAGVKVLMVGQEPIQSQVQAVLNPDGSGKITFAQTEDERDDVFDMIGEVMEFLSKLDYAGDKTWFPVQACVKFWFQHNLGPLVVFPHLHPVKSVRRMLEHKSMLLWNRYTRDRAFLLPVTGVRRRASRVSANTKEKYGNNLAKAVFQGGGPLLLPNSERLVTDVLRNLGYLDDGFNSDPFEALLVFINTSENKRYLRKLEAMPADEDTCSTIRSKLHQALMCTSLPGQWMKAPPDAFIKQHLVSRKFLDTVHEPKIDVLTAMQAFAREKHLPSMKSYNGCVWQISNYLNTDQPTRRDLLMPKSLLG